MAKTELSGVRLRSARRRADAPVRVPKNAPAGRMLKVVVAASVLVATLLPAPRTGAATYKVSFDLRGEWGFALYAPMHFSGTVLPHSHRGVIVLERHYKGHWHWVSPLVAVPLDGRSGYKVEYQPGSVGGKTLRTVWYHDGLSTPSPSREVPVVCHIPHLGPVRCPARPTYKVTSNFVYRSYVYPLGRLDISGKVSPHANTGVVVLERHYKGHWHWVSPLVAAKVNRRSAYDLSFYPTNNGLKTFRTVWYHDGLRTPSPSATVRTPRSYHPRT